jgi:hypothetical protein
MDGEQIPSALAPGLDLFAAAWAEEWIRYGGSIIAIPGGEFNVAYPARAAGPGYDDAPDGLPESVQQARRDFDEAHFHGRMRGLLDMIEAVPHAREALHAHMISHSMREYYTGQPGEEQ